MVIRSNDGMNTATLPELVSDVDLARILGVTSRWLRSEADAGRLPCVQAERRLLFNRDTVERILSERASRERIAAEGAAS